MVSYTTLVEGVLTEVDAILHNYVFDGYRALADYLYTPLLTAIVLYFVFYGISLTQGWMEGSIQKLTKSLLRIGLIFMLGMNWDFFSEYIYTLFYEISGEIGDVIVAASPIPLPTIGGTGINGALQSILIEIWKIAQWIIDMGGLTAPLPMIGGFLVGLVGCFVIAFALAEIIIAKCMLSILFVTAPLFICFTLFKQTFCFFDRWIGSCVSYASLMIFISAALGIIVALDQWILADMYAAKAIGVRFIDIACACAVTIVCILIIRRITMLAMHIGGSVSTASGNEAFAGLVGGFVGASMSTRRGLAYMANKNTLGGKLAQRTSKWAYKGAKWVGKNGI